MSGKQNNNASPFSGKYYPKRAIGRLLLEEVVFGTILKRGGPIRYAGTRITKSRTDRVIDGVCGGLAEYFRIDPVIVRLAFVVLIFINGIGLLLYIILAIIMPKAEKADQPPKETVEENIQEISAKVKEAGEGLGAALSRNPEEKHTNRAHWLGLLLILLGIFFLLDNLNLISWINKDIFWPLIIIFIGAWLLIKRWR